MKLLIDTNVFLEILLKQPNSAKARKLLSATQKHEFFISDFSLHSIGVLLIRRNQHQALKDFVDDMVMQAGTVVLTLQPAEMKTVADTAKRFQLDFDDAYQYTMAEKSGLTMVSFDGDFDRTPRGRRTPTQI